MKIRNSIQIKEFKWRTSNGKRIPLTKLSDDRLIKNYNSIKDRFEKGKITIHETKGRQKEQEIGRQNWREITMLACQQELDKRNIIIG